MTISQVQLKARLGLAAAVVPEFPERRFNGRGIVICAGGPRLFTCAWVAIGILRRYLGCTLPIEVWYMGSKEMGPPMRGLLEDLGARPVDAFEVAKRQQVEQLGGWELKPYALMHSQVREVMLLDADNIPVREPSFLFERPEFLKTGALFWPDVCKLSSNNGIWGISGLTYRDTWSVESGQMVIDKARCWRALSLTHWINQHSNEFYNFLHGDKDTFLIAWLILAQPYYMIPHRPKLLDSTICQRDPEGALLFQHRNLAKWILDGNNPRIEGFRLEDECRTLLKELAGLWDGRIFHPPPRSEQACRLERDLSQIRQFRFVRISSDERRMELLSDHRVGAGTAAYERYWYITDGLGGPELHLEGNGIRSCTLRHFEDGKWRGRLLRDAEMPVELVPAADSPAVGKRYSTESAETLSPLVDRVLETGASLPWDREVARDLVGALRILAAMDPTVIERLKSEERHCTPASARAQIVHAALAGLVEPAWRPDCSGITPGHDWLNAPLKLNWDGYKR